MLCTFTEKAAFEMRDRLAAAARKVGYTGDLSELTVSTIHSLCNRILTQHRHRTELGHSYETLDELTQLLFIFEHFDEIIGPPENDLFLRPLEDPLDGDRGRARLLRQDHRGARRSRAARGLRRSVPRRHRRAYRAYERALLDANRTDFAHLQRLVLRPARRPRAPRTP